MIQKVSGINNISNAVFRSNPKSATAKNQTVPEYEVISVYGDNPIRTNPAQLSLFVIHDFHGQNVRMEKAYSASKQFDDGKLTNEEAFSKDLPVDKIKVASGDIFLGENKGEVKVANEFLNIAGIAANTLGNHECDSRIEDFAEAVANRKYKLLGANMHPVDGHKINDIISESFIIESNGNKYGIIGLVPPDMKKHLKRPEDVEDYNISDLENTVKDLKEEVKALKEQGVNKIIVLSHTGLDNEKYIAQNVSDIDIILGAHTHNLLKEVKEDENFFLSPKGEPVLIMQVGRDGEFIGHPNVHFNELGQITKIQYNVLRTDDFERNLIAKSAFENILGKPDVVGRASYVEEPPKDIYAAENPHCDFIMDCVRAELGTDIGIMNAANIRGRFYKGDINTRELALISPFGNKMCVIKASEAELVNSMNSIIKRTMESEFHRPGIFQVSGLRYEYSISKGKLTKLYLVDKNGKETPIDIENPRNDKFYTIAIDDYCATSNGAGMDLKHRYDTALANYTCDKLEFVENYLRKHPEPFEIKSDGRIQAVE